MNFLFYLAGESGSVGDRRLAEVGLADLAEDCSADWAEVRSGGPDGGGGLIGFWRTGDAERDFRPGLTDLSAVKWARSAPKTIDGLKIDKGAYWVGYKPDELPTPAQLARRRQMPGSEILLPEGGPQWIIPSAPALDRRLVLDCDTGNWNEAFPERFQRYATRAFSFAAGFYEREDELKALVKAYRGVRLSSAEQEAVNSLATVEGKKVPVEEIPLDQLQISIELPNAIEHAVEALGMNYRLNADLINLMGLFTRASVVDICLSSIDGHEVAQALKKTRRTPRLLFPLDFFSDVAARPRSPATHLV